LCQLSPSWRVLGQAHQGTAAERCAAFDQLMERYGGAVRAYVGLLVRDKERADDLFQEFKLRLTRGDFHAADPEKGHFRDCVKTVLFHLVQTQQPQALVLLPTLATNPSRETLEPNEMLDLGLTEAWRDEIMERAWKALEAEETTSGTPYYTILKVRAEQPELDGASLVAELTKQKFRDLEPSSGRTLLQRAREKFAEFIYQDIEPSLAEPTIETVSKELADVGLLEYCRSAVQKRRQKVASLKEPGNANG
jgi:RNA polymerase sigma-70 factor (ECF subfamily)